MEINNTNDRIKKLIDVVQNNRRHINYDYVVNLAANYRAFITGDGLDEKLRRLRIRETDEEFQQRKRITKHIVTAITSTLAAPAQKIPRSTGITRGYELPDKNRFDMILNNFYGDHDLEYYMANKVIPKYYSDPNAWQIIEHTGTDGSILTQPYSFEVSSEEAIYFEKTNGKLDFIIVRIIDRVDVGDNKEREVKLPGGATYTYYDKYKVVDREIYTYYDKTQAIKLTQVVDREINIKEDLDSVDIEGDTYIRLNKKIYKLEVPEPYNLSQVPAFVNGYKLDERTNGATYINPWHECLPILEKLINANSELDISSVLHVFPQKLTYLPRCNNPECNSGLLPDGVTKCSLCKGTGIQPVATSGQDAITLALPTNKDDLFDLQQLVTYVTSMPIDLIKWQAEYIDKVSEYCKRVAFNSDIYTYSGIAKTATGENISMQAIYDTLYPMALAWVDMYYNIVLTCAELTDMADGLRIIINVSKDFRLETKEQIINMLKSLRESNASPAAILEIQKRLIDVVLQDDPAAGLKYVIKEKFYPFSEKKPEEIRLIVSGLPVDNYYRVLWTFYDVIWDELEMTHPEIYTYNDIKIKSLLDEKVNQLQESIRSNNTIEMIDLT